MICHKSRHDAMAYEKGLEMLISRPFYCLFHYSDEALIVPSCFICSHKYRRRHSERYKKR